MTRPDTITAHHPEIDAAFAQTRTWHDDPKSIALLSLYQQRIKNKETKTPPCSASCSRSAAKP